MYISELVHLSFKAALLGYNLRTIKDQLVHNSRGFRKCNQSHSQDRNPSRHRPGISLLLPTLPTPALILKGTQCHVGSSEAPGGAGAGEARRGRSPPSVPSHQGDRKSGVGLRRSSSQGPGCFWREVARGITRFVQSLKEDSAKGSTKVPTS